MVSGKFSFSRNNPYRTRKRGTRSKTNRIAPTTTVVTSKPLPNGMNKQKHTNGKKYNFTKEDVLNATIKNHKAYDYAFYNFKQFLKQYKHEKIKNLTVDIIVKKRDIFLLNNVFCEFMLDRFNVTGNTGNTIRNQINGILFHLAKLNFHVNARMLPGLPRYTRGINILAQNKLNKNVGKQKRAILLPILEAMLQKCDLQQRLGLLIGLRFVLRSEHYCINENEYYKWNNVKFIPNVSYPITLQLTNTRDKNHQIAKTMVKESHCCCRLGWSCVVHTAKQVWDTYKPRGLEPLVQIGVGGTSYNEMLKFVKVKLSEVGVDPREYGTHSLRAGGTTELFITGHSALWIAQFGHWKSISGMMTYLRPNNPDLALFWSKGSYEQYRKNESKCTTNHCAANWALMAQVKTIAKDKTIDPVSFILNSKK